MATVTHSPISLDELLELRTGYRCAGRRVVSTNGCFDLLHVGHVRFLREARTLGDVLVVALNSDRSVRQLKGAGRPLVQEAQRAEMLLSLPWVDHVVIFDDILPTRLLASLKPDLHCKAGDYSPESLPEAEVVRAAGGEIRILPLVPGFSTTDLLERARLGEVASGEPPPRGDLEDQVISALLADANVLRQAAYQLYRPVIQVATVIAEAIGRGNKLLLCGNGGSAAMAQHLAAELVGRFRRERSPWPVLALSADSAVLTALGNDYGFEEVFARQVVALGVRGDVLVAMSTSGASRNILRAVEAARERGLLTIGLTGSRPSALSTSVDLPLCVPAEETCRIQLAHLGLLHVISGLVERMLSRSDSLRQVPGGACDG